MTTITHRGTKFSEAARRQLAEQQRADSADDFKHMRSKEAAEWIGVTVRTLERWRKVGVGPPPIQIGTRYVYTRDRIKAWQRDGGDTNNRRGD